MSEPVWAATVRALAVGAGLTHGELAEQAGIRANTLSEALNGHTSPRMRTLENIATALKVPIWRLFVDDQQAALLMKQEQANAVLVRESEMEDRIRQAFDQYVPVIAQAVRGSGTIAATGQEVGPPANPPSVKPQLAPAVRPARKRRRA